MDRQWFKRLAGASYANGAWSYPALKPQIKAAVFNSSTDHLYSCLVEGVEAYNFYAPMSRQLKHFKLKTPQSDIDRGFAILVGTLQIQVEFNQDQAMIRVQAVLMHGQGTRSIPMYALQLCEEGFGDVVWMTTEQRSLETSRLAKKIIADSCQVAFETGVFSV